MYKRQEEGCLSLDGVRKTTRYQEIEVEYYDFNWKKQRQKLSGWTAPVSYTHLDVYKRQGLYLEDCWVDWHGFLQDAYGVLQLLEFR